eukprot:gnl/Dysnectes_brevis/4448_a5987_404.p1 GENE.gnl/Dysnectes_brevis/4448_a5987_404~~gnl/Dysnectes_brevis/4448_a5987_404.p1  ORF type:complete len:346 (+),score=95.39 gnl/Dysnectes_brevis/4448_a5987_404:233-1270(+)
MTEEPNIIQLDPSLSFVDQLKVELNKQAIRCKAFKGTQDYVNTTRFNDSIRKLIERIAIEKPENPLEFAQDFFRTLSVPTSFEYTPEISIGDRAVVATMVSIHPAFVSLHPERQREIVTALQEATFDKGANVIAPGAISPLFFIKAGTIECVSPTGTVLSVLRPGSHFGDLGLFHGIADSNSYRVASEAASLLFLARGIYQNGLFESAASVHSAPARILGQHRLTSGLSDHEASCLGGRCLPAVFDTGAEIMVAGSTADGLLIVINGKGHFNDPTSYGDPKPFGRGDMLCVSSVLLGEAEPIAAVCTEVTECLCIPLSGLQALPAVHRKLMAEAKRRKEEGLKLM